MYEKYLKGTYRAMVAKSWGFSLSKNDLIWGLLKQLLI
jgi:hypothetical protein